MTVGLVLTVKNESRLLRQNLLFHSRIGIAKIFVYFDGTSDNGPDTIKDIPNVICQNSVSAKEYSNFEYLRKFWSNAREHHTARQCLNTFDAMIQCRKMNIPWLISLDADEIFLPSITEIPAIVDFFSSIPKHIDVVQFQTREVIGRQLHYQNVIAEETLFKTQKNFKSTFDRIYFPIFNPYTKTNKKTNFWLGHTMGKSAFRTDTEIIPKNVHRYTTISRRKIQVLHKGFLLHYHLYDFLDFIKKYENFKFHPDTFLSGNKIEYLKSLWIRLVNDPNYSEKKLKTYYLENLFYNPERLKRLEKTRWFPFIRRKEPAVQKIDIPKMVLSKT